MQQACQSSGGAGDPHRLAVDSELRCRRIELADAPVPLLRRAHHPTLAELTDELRRICDPDALDRATKAEQADLLERSGAREPAIARGGPGFSVPPGVTPQFD